MLNSNTEVQKGKSIKIPFDKIQIGDIIVSKTVVGKIEKELPWENWHHAGLISYVNGNEIKVIETPGGDKHPIGPIERNINDSSFKNDNITEILLLKPKFSKKIKEKGEWYIPSFLRKEITEAEARNKVIEYAMDQIGEDYVIKTTKWSDDDWYCSKLVFKAYSITISGMYLETYELPLPGILPAFIMIKEMSSGFYITPEDIVDSKKTESYYHFIKE